MKSFRLQLRFLLPLAVLLVAAAYITVPLMDSLTMRWFRRDLDLRARFIAESLSGSVADLRGGLTLDAMQADFNRATRDERLLGLGLCDARGSLVLRSPDFPPGVDCGAVEQSLKEGNSTLSLVQGEVHLASLPFSAGPFANAHLVVLHDLSYVHRRNTDSRNYLIIFFTCLGLAIALVTVLVAHLSWRGWVQGTLALLRGESVLQPFASPPELQMIAGDLRAMLADMDEERRISLHAEAWSAERLRNLLNTELRGEQVIVVSNREPYIHNRGEDGGIQVQRPASGLVTAIEPVMRACSGTWIAYGSGSADREVVDRHDRVQVPPGEPGYTLRRIWLSEEEEQGYYYGFSNEGLWPLCHLAHTRPVFRLSDWEVYRSINRRFADAVIAEARTEDPVVLVQDYHFALLPQMLRERLPNATIITFWHIPWPNPESFGVCPWHQDILRGLLGSSIVGFHTRYHCRNFLESVDRYLEARIRLEESTVSFAGELSCVRNYPISIHWPSPEESAAWPAVADCRRGLRERLGLAPDHLVALGVDRFDYTKGIIERLHAVDRLITKYPELRGRFSFVQFAAPTRSALDEYQLFAQQATTLAERINRRHGRGSWQPVRLIAEHQDPAVVLGHYRGADACLVTSLHDGMNLVAKEFVAARDDLRGALVLSEFTGAARELSAALIVNPYDVERTADAIFRAVTMSPGEQAERMRSLRAIVSEDNIYRWAANMLLDAARMRRTERISARIESRGERS